jgi:hypothetical protein
VLKGIGERERRTSMSPNGFERAATLFPLKVAVEYAIGVGATGLNPILRSVMAGIEPFERWRWPRKLRTYSVLEPRHITVSHMS